MKKVLTLTLLLLFGFTSASQAQTSASATINVNVMAALSIVKNQNLNFGDLAQGVSSTIAVTDAQATKFTISGEPAANVTFTLTDPGNLANGLLNTLPFTANIRCNNLIDNPATATTLSNNQTVALNESGNAYVYLGGTVSASTTQVKGIYSGTYTVQVDY